MVDLGFAAVGGTILSPRPSLGGSLSLRLSGKPRDAVSPSLGLAFIYLPNDFLLQPGEVATRLMAGALTACPPWGLSSGRFRVQPCVEGAGGWLTATDRTVTHPASASRIWWSAGALLRASAALGAGFSFEIEAGAAVPIVHRRFMTVTPERIVVETPSMSALVGIGLVREL
jgi:hypothetical protein